MTNVTRKAYRDVTLPVVWGFGVELFVVTGLSVVTPGVLVVEADNTPFKTIQKVATSTKYFIFPSDLYVAINTHK